MSRIMGKLSEPKILIPVLLLLAVLVVVAFSNTMLTGSDHGHVH
jgi:hypothetical protein